LSGTAKAST